MSAASGGNRGETGTAGHNPVGSAPTAVLNQGDDLLGGAFGDGGAVLVLEILLHVVRQAIVAAVETAGHLLADIPGPLDCLLVCQ